MISLLSHPRYRDRVIDTLSDVLRETLLQYVGFKVTEELVEEIREEIRSAVLKRFPFAADRLLDMNKPIDEAIALYVCGGKIAFTGSAK